MQVGVDVLPTVILHRRRPAWQKVDHLHRVGTNLCGKRWIIGILGFRLGKSFWLHITGWPHCCFATFRYPRRFLLHYTCDIQWSQVCGERCWTYVGTKATTFWYISRMSIVTFPVLNCDDRAPIWRVGKTRNGSCNQATLCSSDQWIGVCWRYIGGGCGPISSRNTYEMYWSNGNELWPSPQLEEMWGINQSAAKLTSQPLTEAFLHAKDPSHI